MDEKKTGSAYYNLSVQEVLKQLNTRKEGLDKEEAAKR
ncbi:MAG: cation-transporting P-type ATPase, partial [Bacteroidales bacterium]